MVRTTLSCCALFGSLFFVSKLLQESNEPSPTAPAAAATQPVDDVQQVAPERFPPVSVEKKISHPLIVQTAFEEEPQAGNDPFSDLRFDALLSEPAKPVRRKAADLPLEVNPLRGENDASDVDASADEAPTGDAPADKPDSKPAENPTDTDEKPPQPALTPDLLELRRDLRECLAYYFHRPENVATRSPWGTMHAMVAYGVDTEVIAGDRRVNAIGWLCYNGTCNGQQLFHTKQGRLQARIGVGVQGHEGQFLAMLAQSRVKTDYPIKVDGLDFTVADLVQLEKDTCRPASELTFKLISLVHYLKSDEKWKSNDGQDWDIPRLIQEELKQPIVGAACGGTHRMTGFSYAVRKRQQRKEPFTGQWLRAKKFVDAYHEYTFRLQNPDGSFSTDWFAGRADSGPPSRRLETTGHITEWLAYSLSEEELRDPRMIKSVRYLTHLLLDGRDEKWAIGPLGHGLHALAIYDERVFGGKPGQRGVQLARETRNTFD